jgi:hypothetical protein
MLVPLFVKVVDNGIKLLDVENEPIYKDNDTTISDILAFDGKVIRSVLEDDPNHFTWPFCFTL